MKHHFVAAPSMSGEKQRGARDS